jgi:ribonuclease HII
LRPDFFFEDAEKAPVCGIDEVGRGPLAGPVVAAAVIIDRSRAAPGILAQINDSKRLTTKKREYLFNHIYEFSEVSIAICDVDTIDRINILNASLQAMKEACEKLSLRPFAALIDGNKAPKLFCRAKTIIAGDAKSLSIAAASIIAKHTRDDMMKTLAADFPHYSWETNAGYGTAKHLKAIQIHGVTPHHRRSFAPVSEFLNKQRSAKN